jgi:hypothetical protein
MLEVHSYVEILNKLVADLQAAIAPKPFVSEEEKKKHAQLKQFLEPKLEVLQTKVMPVVVKKTVTLQDILDAQSITCYHDLSYCCGIRREGRPGKDCPWRDAARAALHISDDLYVQKEVVVWQLLAATERSEEWIEENAANLPQKLGDC